MGPAPPESPGQVFGRCGQRLPELVCAEALGNWHATVGVVMIMLIPKSAPDRAFAYHHSHLDARSGVDITRMGGCE